MDDSVLKIKLTNGVLFIWENCIQAVKYYFVSGEKYRIVIWTCNDSKPFECDITRKELDNVLKQLRLDSIEEVER